jgi:YHS domain-containing protein
LLRSRESSRIISQKEDSMVRSYIRSAIAGALVLGLATQAVAATKGQFGNMCTMGLALHKNVATNCSVNTIYKGKTYCFGNEQAKNQFLKNPKTNLAKAETFYRKEHRG